MVIIRSRFWQIRSFARGSINYVDYSRYQTDKGCETTPSKRIPTDAQAREFATMDEWLTAAREAEAAGSPMKLARTAKQAKAFDVRARLLRTGAVSRAEVEATGSEMLLDLYRRIKEDSESELYGVTFSKDKAEMIMPYEYWDTTSTLEGADVNGERFKQYCLELGVLPRFCGLKVDRGMLRTGTYSVEGGEHCAYTDFSSQSGYWKLLVDRRMFGNDGRYQPQKQVSLTKLAENMDPQANAEAEDYAPIGGNFLQTENGLKKSITVKRPSVAEWMEEQPKEASAVHTLSDMLRDIMEERPDEQTIRTVAESAIRASGSSMDVEKVIGALEKVADFVTQTYDPNSLEQTRQIWDTLQDIAKSMLREASMLDVEHEERYAALRSFLRQHPITLFPHCGLARSHGE